MCATDIVKPVLVTNVCYTSIVKPVLHDFILFFKSTITENLKRHYKPLNNNNTEWMQQMNASSCLQNIQKHYKKNLMASYLCKT
jgi:hypothetical protein